MSDDIQHFESETFKGKGRGGARGNATDGPREDAPIEDARDSPSKRFPLIAFDDIKMSSDGAVSR
jgi:hypothetical protein